MRQPSDQTTAHVNLRVPDAACQECRRAAREVLEGLEGVLLVEVAQHSDAIAVTYDSGLIDAVDIYQAGQQAGCVST